MFIIWQTRIFTQRGQTVTQQQEEWHAQKSYKQDARSHDHRRQVLWKQKAMQLCNCIDTDSESHDIKLAWSHDKKLAWSHDIKLAWSHDNKRNTNHILTKSTVGTPLSLIVGCPSLLLFAMSFLICFKPVGSFPSSLASLAFLLWTWIGISNVSIVSLDKGRWFSITTTR